MDFIQGEHVIMNTQSSPATHGKKAIVLKTFDKDGKLLVSVDGSKGYLVLPEQLDKVDRDPALNKFLSDLQNKTIPPHVETAAEEKDREQDELIVKINSEKKLHNTAFNEGYEKGWQDAVNHFQGILKKNGY